MLILNAENTRQAEIQMTQRGVSLLELMERAGRCSFEVIKRFIELKDKKVVIVCGKGNNGGDGFVIARHMLDMGVAVKVILAMGQPKTEDAMLMFGRLDSSVISEFDEQAKEDILSADIIVDCIFGIGLNGAVRQPVSDIIDIINKSGAKKFSIDVPSGMSSDSGALVGACVNAEYTVTFTSLKPCHVIYPARQLCGNVVVADVGISHDICESLAVMKSADENMVKSMLPKRFANSNKGNYGKLMSICGSMRMVGAAAMAGMAAMRCGLGLRGRKYWNR